MSKPVYLEKYCHFNARMVIPGKRHMEITAAIKAVIKEIAEEEDAPHGDSWVKGTRIKVVRPRAIGATYVQFCADIDGDPKVAERVATVLQVKFELKEAFVLTFSCGDEGGNEHSGGAIIIMPNRGAIWINPGFIAERIARGAEYADIENFHA